MTKEFDVFLNNPILQSKPFDFSSQKIIVLLQYLLLGFLWQVASCAFPPSLKNSVHVSISFACKLIPAEDGESDEHVVLVSQSGTVNRIKIQDVSIQSRFAR